MGEPLQRHSQDVESDIEVVSQQQPRTRCTYFIEWWYQSHHYVVEDLFSC